jgi:hypothetical protein
LRVEKEDGWLGRIEAAHSAGCGICDVPKRGVVIMGVGEVDERHSMDDSTREGETSINVVVISATVIINEGPGVVQ